MEKNLRLVYITTSNKEEARLIGHTLVKEKIAACVNILDGMESLYNWNGNVESANETVLIAKTTTLQMEYLTKKVLELHSYECPCIISYSINEDEGNQEYLRWLVKESGN